MIQISIEEMKRDFSAYLHHIEAGETLVIVKGGKPLAEIRPFSTKSMKVPVDKRRPFGLCAGEFTVSDDFNEPLPESILAEFEGR